MVRSRSLGGGGHNGVQGGPIRRTGRRLLTHAVFLTSFLLGDDWMGRRARILVLRASGARIAPGASLHGGSYISDPRNLVMGPGSFLNRNCYLDLSGPLVVEAGVVVGHGVTFITIEHLGLPRQGGREAYHRILLKQRCWIGANATLLPGVTIGSYAVVAAGALVTHDVPDGCVVAGVPARIIRAGTDEAVTHS